MKIYTRTGDAGKTGLYGGARVMKTSARIRAIGDVDELNAALGMARSGSPNEYLRIHLDLVQNWLFNLGAELATVGDRPSPAPLIGDDHVSQIEASIDHMSAQLAPLKEFILPGGTSLAASLHYARCVCRRAERTVLELSAEEAVREESLRFLNRLSDWLFVAARTANAAQGVVDVPWRHTDLV